MVAEGPQCPRVQAAEDAFGHPAGTCLSSSAARPLDPGTNGTTRSPKLALHSTGLRTVPIGNTRDP